MNLETLLSTHDDAALEALASKGVVRRARRDLEVGLASITDRSKTTATVSADGQTVAVDARGLGHCRCSCPAGGVCRHIVLAVIALRAAGSPQGPPAGDTDAGPGALDDIRSMSEAKLRKFAGAAWQAAVELADASGNAAIHAEGRNCRVEFVSAAVTVTFIAGQPMKTAAFRGPKSRARVVTTAAALVVRARHGIGVEPDAPQETLPDPPNTAFLEQATRAVLRAVPSVLAGPSPLTIDTLFDLAISARAEAAPRLSAELRTLAAGAGLALARDVSFEPERFLAAAAHTTALIEGLRAAPSDPALTGSLRRDYETGDAIELWLLAASCWRSAIGARGVSFHAFSPSDRSWYSCMLARAAGQDLTFDPRSAYRQPLWGVGQPENLMARRLKLVRPLIAADRSIAVSQQEAATIAGRHAGVAELVSAGAAHARWSELRADLAGRFGGGLRRRSLPVPAAICPARFGGFAFDELAQVYEIEVIDESGAALVLTLPADCGELAQRLHREGHGLRLVCVEASSSEGRANLRPIAVGMESAGALEIVNLDLDFWQPQGVARAALNRLREIARTRAGPRPSNDPLRKIAMRALEAATAAASGASLPNGAQLAAECESVGLLTLAKTLERLAAAPDVAKAMRVAYVAAEVEAATTWT